VGSAAAHPTARTRARSDLHRRQISLSIRLHDSAFARECAAYRLLRCGTADEVSLQEDEHGKERMVGAVRVCVDRDVRAAGGGAGGYRHVRLQLEQLRQLGVLLHRDVRADVRWQRRVLQRLSIPFLQRVLLLKLAISRGTLPLGSGREQGDWTDSRTS
jgi:hypothetical protein